MTTESLASALEREHHEIDEAILDIVSGRTLKAGRHQTEPSTSVIRALRRHSYLEEPVLVPAVAGVGAGSPTTCDGARTRAIVEDARVVAARAERKHRQPLRTPPMARTSGSTATSQLEGRRSCTRRPTSIIAISERPAQSLPRLWSTARTMGVRSGHLRGCGRGVGRRGVLGARGWRWRSGGCPRSWCRGGANRARRSRLVNPFGSSRWLA